MIVGSGGLIIAAVVQYFTFYSMNTLLAQVRSLSLITHLMMMQLTYPAVVTIFYSVIFEFVVFDFIPTDQLYDDIFDFENEPYSEQADSIGYPSRYTIYNAGSITIYIVALALAQILYSLFARILPRGNFLSDFVVRKRDQFRWAGLTDFVNDTCLSLSFCVIINTTKFGFNSWQDSVNSVFMIVVATLIVMWPIKVTLSTRSMWK